MTLTRKKRKVLLNMIFKKMALILPDKDVERIADEFSIDELLNINVEVTQMNMDIKKQHFEKESFEARLPVIKSKKETV